MTRFSRLPRNRSKRAARRPSSIRSRRCGQAQESLGHTGRRQGSAGLSQPRASVQLEGRPAMPPAGGPQSEWRHMLPPHTPKAAPPTDKARPISAPIETAAAGASHADASRRHQLNAVLPVLGHAASPAAGPGPDIMPKITPPISGRGAPGQQGLSCSFHSVTLTYRLRQTRKRLSKPGRPWARPPPSP